MAMKRYSVFPKAPALLEPPHQSVLSYPGYMLNVGWRVKSFVEVQSLYFTLFYFNFKLPRTFLYGLIVNYIYIYIYTFFPLLLWTYKAVRLLLYYYYYLEFFTSAFDDGFFSWSLSDSKSPQVSTTVLSILAVFNNAVVWIVSTRRPISKSSRHFNNPLVTVPIAPITTGTSVTFMFHSFF